MKMFKHFNFFNVFIVMATFAFCLALANSLFIPNLSDGNGLDEMQADINELKESFINERSSVETVEEESGYFHSSYIAKVSAYTNIETGCMSHGCKMKNGEKAHYGAVACSREIDLGTEIEIEGMGVFVCKDRLAPKYDSRVDVFMGYGEDAYNQAIEFGVQEKQITLLQ